jgi:hypothetical protein
MKVDVVRNGQFLVIAQLTIDRSVISHAPKDRRQTLRELAVAVAELRQDAKEKGLNKMPMSEINRAVAAARRDLKKNTKRAVR